jgi:glycosyltransferase involved in cell wall biosynthesis
VLADRLRASIVIPTRNRAARLEALLASLAAQTVPADEFEILVVDNGSTDATATVIDEWAARRPGVRRVYQPELGVSRARNAGLAEARAAVVAFLDDDVLTEPGWLAGVLGAWDRWPDAGVVCGPADLHLGAPAPRWFGPETGVWYSTVDFGSEARILRDPEEVPWGLNLAVRTDLARAAGGFAEHLGRSDGNLRGGEDVHLVARIRRPGNPVVYEPRAAVHHVVTKDRLRLGWLLRRAWDGGLDALECNRAAGGRHRPGVPAALGRAGLRGWREATRRVRRADSVVDALLSEVCHRIAAFAVAWNEWETRRS